MSLTVKEIEGRLALSDHPAKVEQIRQQIKKGFLKVERETPYLISEIEFARWNETRRFRGRPRKARA